MQIQKDRRKRRDHGAMARRKDSGKDAEGTVDGRRAVDVPFAPTSRWKWITSEWICCATTSLSVARSPRGAPVAFVPNISVIWRRPSNARAIWRCCRIPLGICAGFDETSAHPASSTSIRSRPTDGGTKHRSVCWMGPGSVMDARTPASAHDSEFEAHEWRRRISKLRVPLRRSRY